MFDTTRFMLFTLIFMRMTGFILLNPILGRRNIPNIVKSGFIFVLAILVYLNSDSVALSVQGPLDYGILLLKEFASGFTIGFVISLFLYIIVFAGEFIDLQLGISMAKIFDVQSNSSLSLSATFFNVLFILTFFLADGHLALIKLIITSGEFIPYGNILISRDLGIRMLKIFSECSIFAVKLSLPFLAVEFLLEIGSGILMKAIPEINIFIINIQLKLFVGLLLLLVFFLPVSSYLGDIMVIMFDTIKEVIQML